MMRTLAVLALAGSLLPPAESAGQQAPARLQAATDLLNAFVADGKIAGAVAAVARGDRVEYLAAVGVQDVATRAPMTERSLFRIYSMSKSVTSVAAMMLHEEGRFQLEDPVSKYLPEFDRVRVRDADGSLRRPSRPITVQDLFLHTSGLNHRTSELYIEERVRSRADPLPVFVEKIVQAPLMEDPGTRYRYSEGTTVLGRLVEVWSGRPLDEFMDERIFRPLRMVDTGFHVRPDQRSRLTTMYRQEQGGGLTPFEIEEIPFTERPALLEGAVGLVSTAPDYLRFAQMLLNGGELDGARLLSAATVERMTRNGLSPEVLSARGGGMGWGLANVNVVVDPSALPDPAPLGEYTWNGSAGTIFWVDPSTRTAIVLLTQNQPGNPDSLRQRFKALVLQSLAPSR